MSNNKYKEKNKSQIKMIIISCMVLLMLLIILLAISKIKQKDTDYRTQNTLGVFKTVEDVLKYYECTYTSERKSTKEGYDIDINLVFKYPLYTNDINNESFYNKVLNSIAEVIDYKNFRMIDSKNNIEIEVICSDRKIKEILINGIKDFFIYMDSQIDLKEYKEIKEIKVNISSSELINTINKDWDSSIDFGLRDSIFKNYYIYFNKGLETRRISGKIYNIIFNERYGGEVLPEITVGTDFDLIKRKLGTPSFEDKDLEIIGYKCEEFYIFFCKDEISVYRRDVKETDQFLKLLDEFLKDEKDLNEFLNKLTYIWPDYSEYIKEENSFFISYPLKGMDIKYNYDNTSGIIIYNNFNATQKMIAEYLEHTELIAKLKVDNVFEAEKRRKDEKDNLIRKVEKFKGEVEKQENTGESAEFAYYIDFDENGYIATVYFISKDKNNINSELSESIYTYAWLSDDYFLYGIRNKGIYLYNVTERTKKTLVSGTDEFEIKECNNGVLKYDDKEVRIDY